jgi:hypothetical protein
MKAFVKHMKALLHIVVERINDRLLLFQCVFTANLSPEEVNKSLVVVA